MNERGAFPLVVAWFVLLMLFTAGAAEAEPQDRNRQLRGDYAFSGAHTCLVSIGGFDPDLTPVNSPAPFPFVTSFIIQGVRTFNGDGTGQVVARSVSVSHPYALPNPAPPHFFSRGGASSSDVAANFTYEVAPDGTLTIGATTVTGTILTGTRAGQTFTIVNVPSLVGLIAKSKKALTIAHDEPGVETISFSNGDVQHRICPRARIHLELQDGD